MTHFLICEPEQECRADLRVHQQGPGPGVRAWCFCCQAQGGGTFHNFYSGLRIRSIFGQIRIFKTGSVPDPDSTGTHLEWIQAAKFFSNQSDFFRYFYVDFFLPEKMEKFTWKCVKAEFCKTFFSLFIQFYIARVGSGYESGENFPDSAKKGRINLDFTYLWWIVVIHV